MQRAVFAGSFDPPTLGHINLIERSASLFEELLVVAAANSQKNSLFSPEERLFMLQELTKSLKNVSVFVWDSLMADFMRQHNAKILVRGVRGAADFEYESEIAAAYRVIDPAIETILLPADIKLLSVRSSTIKELASFNVDISSMVPPLVADALKAKF
jgi:pantetheine-phosphate adenylyltransferase